MQWSKNFLRKDAAENKVLEFVPQKFELGTPNEAHEYLKSKKHGSDFQMSDVIRAQTGVDKIERVSEEEKIENRVLEKLKEIQEQAYKEAYQLGLDEGRIKAFEEFSAHIEENLKNFGALIKNIETLKIQMLNFNESHLVKLMYHMASRIAHTHLENNNLAIVEIIKTSVSLAQDEEEITVRVSDEQYNFLEQLKLETKREYDFLKKIKIEPSNQVSSGGCIVETNYGEVDARVEQRTRQLWEGLSDNLIKVKNKLVSNE
jgi:flagellar assembly protein FliH